MSLIRLTQESAPGDLCHGIIKEIKANEREGEREKERYIDREGERDSFIRDRRRRVASASIIFSIRSVRFCVCGSQSPSFSFSQPDLISRRELQGDVRIFFLKFKFVESARLNRRHVVVRPFKIIWIDRFFSFWRYDQ